MEKLPFCFLNVFKEKGITSFDVIYKLRKILGIKKIGHSGTLDPMAEGVMQVAIGGATRLIEYLPSDKTYIAEIKFGYSSTTLDLEGDIKKANDPLFSKDELEFTIKKFEGKITQVPPKFSAIKVKGKKLCDMARKNPDVEIEIPKREVEIYKINLLNFDMKNYTTKIEVDCSKGTYIRTLAQDIAHAMKTEAYLLALTRTKAGNFRIENSIKTEYINLEKNGIEPSFALDLIKYELNQKEYELIINGVSINSKLEGNFDIMLLYNKKLVSIGILSDNKIKVKKVFK